MFDNRELICAAIRTKLENEDVPCYDINYVINGQIITELRFEVRHNGVDLFCVAQVTNALLRLRLYLKSWQVRHEENFTYFCLHHPLSFGYLSYDDSRAIYHESNSLLFEDMLPTYEGIASMMKIAREYLTGSFLLQTDSIGRKYLPYPDFSVKKEGLIIKRDEVHFPGLLSIILHGRSNTLEAEMSYEAIGQEHLSTCTICLGDFKGTPVLWSLNCEQAQAILRAQGTDPFNTYFWQDSKLFMRAQFLLPERLIVSDDNRFTLEVDRDLGAVRMAGGSEDDWIWLPLK